MPTLKPRPSKPGKQNGKKLSLAERWAKESSSMPTSKPIKKGK